MKNCTDLPIPDLKIGDRVKVTSKIIISGSAIGTITNLPHGLTNEFISVGVKFDKRPVDVYFFYPFECEKINE